LMHNRVKEILLVSTFYDAFIFEQDGRLSEQIFGEYKQLNLSTAPKVTSVPTGEDALRALKDKQFDLVITMLRIGSISPFELVKQIKAKQPDLPVLLLLNVQSDIQLMDKYQEKLIPFDNVFLWNGDSKLFLAMVKSIEDRRNVEYDTKNGFVRVILLVEDSIQYYSIFLPLLYSEIVKQTQILIREELSDINKRLRMRARPKVILAHDFEEAYKIYQKYKEYIIAIISDISYKHNGKIDSEAGIKLISKISEEGLDVPNILSSSDLENKEKADKINATFLHKYSKHLLHDLRKFIVDNLGFGDFVFRNNKELEIARASSLSEFEEKLKIVPDESLIYHSKRNHFSAWLMARGEIEIAKKIRPLKIKDFSSTEEIRKHLLSSIKTIQKNRNKGKIINFDPSSLNRTNEIVRLCEGSLGGKGRGLAFLNALLVTMEFEKHFTDVHITLPSTAIIGTNEYDFFIEHNHIDDHALEEKDDFEIDQIFLRGELSPELVEKLHILLDYVNYPVAVRSSGLLEDSYSQPFAGIYRTFMLPNNHPDKNVRFQQLTNAIKLVFASVFIKNARAYIENLNYQLEEEKMAVIIQHVAGSSFSKDSYYPHFSGIAQSHNFYPISHLKSEDGIVTVASGLGRTVIEGGKIYRFCPRFPKMEFIQPKALIGNSQKTFYAVDMDHKEFDLTIGENATLLKMDIKIAEEHGALNHIASVWDYQDNRLIPGLTKKGPRVLSFDNILKYNYFPLAEIIVRLLEIGENAFGMPIEIEFAVNLEKDLKNDKFPTFYILQIRPLSVASEEIILIPKKINRDKLLLYTEKGMGNGVITDVKDIIYLIPERFNKLKTLEMQKEIEKLNSKMKKENREYILIGPGRWGSMDRFLGIPVRWFQICNAKVIVETGLEDFNIEPSQGTHFFHNLVSMNVGYFNVPYNSNKDFIDWHWLKKQNVVEKTNYFVHVHIEHPLVIKMDGKKGIAVIYK
ncbi:MAG: hypothetical protein DRP89_06635, partial [Candidatus Neomarinimicrobiota bacterium]